MLFWYLRGLIALSPHVFPTPLKIDINVKEEKTHQTVSKFQMATGSQFPFQMVYSTFKTVNPRSPLGGM